MKKIILLLFILLASATASFGQNNGAMLPWFLPTFMLANGSGPAASGFVCTTTTGTTNSLATYQDPTLLTANQNPIRLNAAGRAVNGVTEVRIYLQAASYRIALYAAGTGNTCNGTAVGALIRSADGVYDFGQFAGNTGSGTANYMTKWTGAHSLGNSQTTDDGTYITAIPSDGRVDTTSWSQSLWRLSRLQNSSSNQFAANIQVNAAINSGATAGYEKTGLLIQTMTADPSGATQRDMVGVDTRCQVWSTISTGRCWGGISIATITSGGDGLAVAHEFAIDNSGSNQPTLDTTTGKYGIHVVAGQTATYTGALTAGIYLNKSYGTMYNGLVSKQDVFSDSTVNSSFIRLKKASATTDLFRVKPNAQLLVGDLPYNSSTGDYDVTYYGQATVREFFTVAGAANTNKQLFSIYVDTTSSPNRVRLGGGRYDNTVSYLPVTMEVGGSELNRWNTDLSLEFIADGSSAGLSSAGTVRLANFNGDLEISSNGAAYVSLGGGGGTSGIGGTGTAGYISKFTAVTTIANTAGPLYEDTGGIGCLVYGGTGCDDNTQMRINSQGGVNGGVLDVVRNSTSNTGAYAGFGARSGVATSQNDIAVGVTSALFTTSGGVLASEAFIRSGVSATAGLLLNSAAGAINFAPDGNTVDFKMTTDDAFELTASSAASVGAAGTVRIRNNAGQLEVSNNGAAYVVLPGAGGSGAGGSGTSGFLSKWSAVTTLTNSAIAEAATSWTATISANSSTDWIVTNGTSGASARAALRATASAGQDIYAGVTSAGYTFTTGASTSQGFIATGTATSNGLLIATFAGPIIFRSADAAPSSASAAVMKITTDKALELTDSSSAAVSPAGAIRLRNNAGVLEASLSGAAYAALGTGGGSIGGSGTVSLVPKFSAATTLANSQIFDDGTTTTIGTQLASDQTTNIRFQVQKDQNESTYALIRNATAGTLAAASWVARSGASGSSLDLAMGVLSTGTSTSSGLVASSAYIRSGAGATAGLYVQSAAGPIIFQPTGTTEKMRLTTTGLGIGVTPSTQLHVLGTAESTRFAATGATVSSTWYASTSTISGTIAGTSTQFDFCFSNTCPSGVGASATTANLFAGDSGILVTKDLNIVFTADGAVGGGVGPPSGNCSGLYAYIGTALACIEFQGPDSGGTGYRSLRVLNTF